MSPPPNACARLLPEQKLTGAYATEDGVPRTQPSVVVYLDVLGFTQQIREAHEHDKSMSSFGRLRTLSMIGTETRSDSLCTSVPSPAIYRMTISTLAVRLAGR